MASGFIAEEQEKPLISQGLFLLNMEEKVGFEPLYKVQDMSPLNRV
jgi:hypothetical protein